MRIRRPSAAEIVVTIGIVVSIACVVVAVEAFGQGLPPIQPLPEDDRLRVSHVTRQPRGAIVTIRTMSGDVVTGKLMASREDDVVIVEIGKKVRGIKGSAIESVEWE